MKLKDYIHILVVLLLLGIGIYRFRNQTYTAQRTQILLGTQIDIKATSKSKDIDKQITSAFELIKRYEGKLSYYDKNSELSKINEAGGEHILDDDFMSILGLAGELYHLSDHLYDVTISSLLDVWEVAEDSIPKQSIIDEAKQNSGFDKISITDNVLTLPPNVKLNFGSLAKGFIVDKVIEYFIVQNVLEASINAGGDIRLYSRGKRKWQIGIQHPRDPHTIIARLHLPDMAVVTSGDYERYVMIEGEPYHHIINPKTGFPSRPTVSVTVISPTAFLADALSTAAFVMPPNEAIDLIKSFPDTEGIIYYHDENDEPIALKTEGIRNYEK